MISRYPYRIRPMPEVKEILERSDADRINYIREEKFILYPKAAEILSKMEDLIKEQRKSRMPCLLVVGDSNNGKTSIVNKLDRMYPPTDGIDEDAVRVVIVQAPFSPDVHLFYDKIMESLILPFKKSDSYSQKEKNIHYHFCNLGVKLLIVDEIHNILSGSIPKQKAFMNALKNLNNEMMLPIVLIGIKDALHATNTDLQISSRFRPMLLPRWYLNRDYISLLASLELTLPLKKPSGLAEDRELAETILDLSEGLLGEIVHFITEASVHAIKTGTEKITIDIIKKCKFDKPSQRRGMQLVETN